MLEKKNMCKLKKENRDDSSTALTALYPRVVLCAKKKWMLDKDNGYV